MATAAETAVVAVPSALSEGLSHKKIPSLDGLRAVSVLLVILNHLEVPYVPDGRGVLTFFVLSGFLITWILLNESSHYPACAANFSCLLCLLVPAPVGASGCPTHVDQVRSRRLRELVFLRQ